MEEKYRNLLGKTYDLEGLLLLALSRREVSADLAHHIREKLEELQELASSVIPEGETQPEPLEEEMDSDLQEVNCEDPDEELAEEPYEESYEDPDEDLTEESYDEPYEEILKEADAGTDGEFIIPKETVEAIEDQLSRFYSLDDDDEDEEEILPPLPTEEKEEKKPTARSERPLFSLNDRFLYTREIFRGNVAAFNAAIDRIMTFDTYEEAEKHFMTELELNPEQNETDRAFLAMIKTYIG